MIRFLLCLSLSLCLAAAAWSGESCRQCGCGACKKVCRLVCETRQETIWCYDCKCEDFCVPGPSCLLGTRCVPDPCNPCRTHREFCWKPSCGPLRERMVLYKVPQVVERPSYRCVVECICCECGQARIDDEATRQLVEEGRIEGIEFAARAAPLTAAAVDALPDENAEAAAQPVRPVAFWQRLLGR